MWTCGSELRRFETETWQRRQPTDGTELGSALLGSDPVVLSATTGASDDRVGFAAEYGVRRILLISVREGRNPVAVLEFLSRAEPSDDEELIVAMEAVAIQLGHFWHLLRVGAQPQWRTGRR